MVQVDVFWSYGLGSSFALAASKQLAAERAAKKGLLDSPYFSKTLLFLSIVFAPSGCVAAVVLPLVGDDARRHAQSAGLVGGHLRGHQHNPGRWASPSR